MGDSPAQSRGGRLSRWRTHCISTTARELLQAIVRRLDRGGSPDRNFPDRDGEQWALCPFHPDRHPNNFSVSQAGYHCFACGASGGLWPLAEKLGVIPPRNASHTGGTTGAAERVHACTREGGDSTHTPTPAPENRTGNVTRVHACTRSTQAAEDDRAALEPGSRAFWRRSTCDATRRSSQAGASGRGRPIQQNVDLF